MASTERASGQTRVTAEDGAWTRDVADHRNLLNEKLRRDCHRSSEEWLSSARDIPQRRPAVLHLNGE